MGKTFLAFPVHAQPAIFRIWQEAHCTVLSLWENEPVTNKESGALPTPLGNSLFEGCSDMYIQWPDYVTLLSQSSQHSGCWLPGAHLASGHLQSSWWCTLVGAYRDPNVMFGVHVRHKAALFQITKTFGSMSIRYRPHSKVLDRYLIDVNPRVFAVEDVIKISYSQSQLYDFNDPSCISMFGTDRHSCYSLDRHFDNHQCFLWWRTIQHDDLSVVYIAHRRW